MARTPRAPALAYKRRRPHPVNPSNRAAVASHSRNPSSRAAIVAELGAHRRAAVPSLPRLQKLLPEHRVVVRTLTLPFPLSLASSRHRSRSPERVGRVLPPPLRARGRVCRRPRILPNPNPSQIQARMADSANAGESSSRTPRHRPPQRLRSALIDLSRSIEIQRAILDLTRVKQVDQP